MIRERERDTESREREIPDGRTNLFQFSDREAARETLLSKIRDPSKELFDIEPSDSYSFAKEYREALKKRL